LLARCVSSAAAATLAGVDAWLGADKAGHFAACAGITGGAWALAAQRARGGGGGGSAAPPPLRTLQTRLALAVALGLLAGIAKEVLDGLGVRRKRSHAHTHTQRAHHALTLLPLAQMWPMGGVASERDLVADAAGVAVAAAVIIARSGGLAAWRERGASSGAAPGKRAALGGVALQEV
jgi:hypothetical protein